MNKKNLKIYWIRPLIIIIGIFFFNSAIANVKVNASKKIFDFLGTIQEFASETEELKKVNISDKLFDMVDLEFMSKVTVGKLWKTVNDKEKIIFKRKLFNKFVDFINLHLEDFKAIKFKEKSVKLRGEKLVYVIGSVDTKKLKT